MARPNKIKNYHMQMRSVKRKRLALKETKPITIREVSNANLNVPLEYTYLVYFDTRREIHSTLKTNMIDIKEFLSSSASGRYSIVTASYNYNTYRIFLDHVKMENETDVLMLMLCKPLHIRKILKITDR